jgi:Concanavalin A-like lectin/glucanases superfamily
MIAIATRKPSLGKLPIGYSVDWSRSITQGLVGDWNLAEGGGLTAINTGLAASANGTLSGSPTWTKGPGGSGLAFPGSGSIVNCGTSSAFECDNAGTSCTLEAWTRMTTTGAGNDNFFLSKAANTSLSNPAIGIGYNDTAFRMRAYYGSSTFNNSGFIFTQNAVTHVVATFVKGGNMNYYVNGILITTASISATTIATSGSVTALGGHYRTTLGSTLNMIGDLYRARWWNRALGQAEVQQLYRDPNSLYAAQRLRYFAIGAATTGGPFPFHIDNSCYCSFNSGQGI